MSTHYHKYVPAGERLLWYPDESVCRAVDRWNVLGCPNAHFLQDEPNCRRRPWGMRVCGLPTLLALAVIMSLPLLAVVGGVWLGLVVVTAVCWVPFLYRMRREFNGHIDDQVGNRAGGGMRVDMPRAADSHGWRGSTN